MWYTSLPLLHVYPDAPTPDLFIYNLPILFSFQAPGQLARPFATAHELVYILTSGYFSFYTKWMTTYTTQNSTAGSTYLAIVFQGHL